MNNSKKNQNKDRKKEKKNKRKKERKKERKSLSIEEKRSVINKGYKIVSNDLCLIYLALRYNQYSSDAKLMLDVEQG